MTDADDQLIQKQAATLEILTLLLIVGIIAIAGMYTFTVLVVFDGRPILNRGLAEVPGLSLIALAVAFPALTFSMIIPGRVRRAAAKKWGSGGPLPGKPTESAVSRLIAAYKRSLILGLALAEVPALLGVIVFVLEAHWLALLPMALGVFAMILMFPSEAALGDWVEDRLAEVPEPANGPA